MFLSFDGIDGTGKTTQVDLLAEHLRALGHAVTTCRDPGSTPLGERLRKIVLDDDPEIVVGARSEMFLYMAARAQLVETVIGPALAAGQTVISDRFLLANVAYQGYAGGLDVAALWQVGQIATAGLQPDLIFLLDMPPRDAQQRIDRPLDRMEQRGRGYQERLRDGFLAEAKRRPEQIVVIDASQSVADIHAEVRAAVARLHEEGPRMKHG